MKQKLLHTLIFRLQLLVKMVIIMSSHATNGWIRELMMAEHQENSFQGLRKKRKSNQLRDSH